MVLHSLLVLTCHKAITDNHIINMNNHEISKKEQVRNINMCDEEGQQETLTCDSTLVSRETIVIFCFSFSLVIIQALGLPSV